MAINLKRINTKFLIIPLSVIVLGGINNSIQAMDDDYGHENPVNTNNNNIINTNKLKEKIKFSDFKDFVNLLYQYNNYYYYGREKDKEKITKQCTDIISLLPQFIQNDINIINSYEICKKQHSEQKYTKDSMISYEMCLHYLLNFRCFCMLEQDFHESSSEYNVFLGELYDYLNKIKNFNKDEYERILIIMLNNFSYCFLRACTYDESGFSDYYKLAFQDSDSHNSYHDFFKYFVCNNPFYESDYARYNNGHDNRAITMMKTEIMYIVGKLAEIEYNNLPSMSMPINTISDKIMNNLIMPCIKKSVFELLYSYCKNEISKRTKIIEESIEFFEDKKNEWGKLYNIYYINKNFCMKKIDELEKFIQQEKQELDKLPKDFELKKMIEQVTLNEERVQQLTKDWPESIKYLVQLTSQVNKALDDKVVISKIRKQLEIDNEVYKATKELRKEELMNTFSKKVKVGNAKIKSKDVVKEINDFTKDNRVVKIMQYTLPVVKQKVNENNESEEVTINNESEKK